MGPGKKKNTGFADIAEKEPPGTNTGTAAFRSSKRAISFMQLFSGASPLMQSRKVNFK